MGIRVSWDSEKKDIIRFAAEGKWTWDHFYLAMDQSRGMMDSAPHSRVDFIVDMSSGNLLPQNAMSHFGRVSNSRHPKAGLLVLVGTNAFVKSLVNVMGRISSRSNVNLRVADSIEDAHRIIAERQVPIAS